MRSFSFSDLNRQSGEVLDAALSGPVTLEKRGKPKLVVMPVALYEILARGRAFSTETAPDIVVDLLEKALEDAAEAD